jgi:hypothetical protein
MVYGTSVSWLFIAVSTYGNSGSVRQLRRLVASEKRQNARLFAKLFCDEMLRIAP